MVEKLDYNYDSKNDTLFIFNSELDYKSSLDMGGLVIDFSKDNKIKGIEITEASLFFSEFLEKEITKENIMKVTNYLIDIKKSKNMYHISLGMKFENNLEVSIPLSTPI